MCSQMDAPWDGEPPLLRPLISGRGGGCIQKHHRSRAPEPIQAPVQSAPSANAAGGTRTAWMQASRADLCQAPVPAADVVPRSFSACPEAMFQTSWRLEYTAQRAAGDCAVSPQVHRPHPACMHARTRAMPRASLPHRHAHRLLQPPLCCAAHGSRSWLRLLRTTQSMDAVNVSALATASAKLWSSSLLDKPHEQHVQAPQPTESLRQQPGPATRAGTSSQSAKATRHLLAELLPALCDLAAAGCTSFRPRHFASVVWALSKLVSWDAGTAPAVAAEPPAQHRPRGSLLPHCRSHAPGPIRNEAEAGQERMYRQLSGSNTAAADRAFTSPCPDEAPRVLQLMLDLTRGLCGLAGGPATAVAPRDVAQVRRSHCWPPCSVLLEGPVCVCPCLSMGMCACAREDTCVRASMGVGVVGVEWHIMCSQSRLLAA